MIKNIDFLTGVIPKRLIVTVMIFVACLGSFMLRVHISVNLLAMVQPIAPDTGNTTVATALEPSTISPASTLSLANDTAEVSYVSPLDAITPLPPAPNYGPRYQWSQNMQSHILGAFFYGYLFTSLPAGPLAERYGPKILIGCSFLLCALITALFPLLAAMGAWAVIIGRFLMGVVSGIVYPTLHNLIARWIPPNEKSKVVACISGGSTFGTVITWPIVGILTERFGWDYAFYFPALVAALIGIIWLLLIENTPSVHKTITKEERELIEASFGDTVSKVKARPPFAAALTSAPYLVLLLVQYSSFWGLNFFVTQAPKFMNEVLGYDLANAGFLSSIPYIARMFSGFFFGFIGDFIRQKSMMSVTAVRKSFCLFSHILPGLFLLILPFIPQDPLVVVSCIVACLGFNGASTITNLVNAQDLAPNFAATLYGFMNFIATTAGFLAPMMVAYFTSEKSTMEEWQYVFYITAGIYIFTGAAFAIFGSGEVQKWNEIKEDSSKETTGASKNEREMA